MQNQNSVITYCEQTREIVRSVHYHGVPFKVIVDARDMRGGEKMWGWIKKGVPLRLEIGPREIEAGTFGPRAPR